MYCLCSVKKRHDSSVTGLSTATIISLVGFFPPPFPLWHPDGLVLWLFLPSSFLHPKVHGSYWLFQTMTNVSCIWEAPTVITEVACGYPQFCEADVRSIPWSNLVLLQHTVRTAWSTWCCQLSCTFMHKIFVKLITLYFNSSTPALSYGSERWTVGNALLLHFCIFLIFPH